MKKFMKEFSQFAIRGNVIDLAVGVIIGGAFSSITTALVQNVIMPFISLFTGNMNFETMVIELGPLFKGAEPAVLGVGTLISTILDFIIIAFVVFWIVKASNAAKERAKKKEDEAPAAPPAPSAEELLLTEIRDLLKEQSKN